MIDLRTAAASSILLLSNSIANALETLTLNNNGPAGTMQLRCPVAAENSIWTLNGETIYSNMFNQPQYARPNDFQVQGTTLINSSPLDGSFIGQYVCYNTDDPASKVAYQVNIPGASSLSGGAIAGIVIGVLLAILLIVGIIFIGWKKGWFSGGEEYDDAEGADIVNDGHESASARFVVPNSRQDDNINNQPQY